MRETKKLRKYEFSFVDMDTNTWEFENEDFLSMAKMKQPLKEGVTFRNQIQEFVVQLVDSEYPYDKSVYDVVYEDMLTLVLEDEHFTTSKLSRRASTC